MDFFLSFSLKVFIISSLHSITGVERCDARLSEAEDSNSIMIHFWQPCHVTERQIEQIQFGERTQTVERKLFCRHIRVVDADGLESRRRTNQELFGDLFKNERSQEEIDADE